MAKANSVAGTSSATLMTSGPIWKRLVAFAIPLFWGNLFQQFYNTADSVIVGNFLGNNALAAVSSSGNLIFLLVGFFNGIAIGAGVVTGKYFGAGDMNNLKKSIHTTVIFGFVCGIVLTIAGIVAAPKILVLMGTPAEVLPESLSYFQVYFTGSLAFVMYNFFVGILQAMGAEITWDGEPWGEVAPGEGAPAAATLTVRGDGVIQGLGRFDMSAAGEIAPSIAALAALADAPTQLVGIAHLRGHETNRLAALVTEIRRIGAEAEELEDGIEIRPVLRERLHGAVMETYADHRMATFAAMIGLTVPDIAVVDVATTRKTIPDFVGLWSAMLG